MNRVEIDPVWLMHVQKPARYVGGESFTASSTPEKMPWLNESIHHGLIWKK